MLPFSFWFFLHAYIFFIFVYIFIYVYSLDKCTNRGQVPYFLRIRLNESNFIASPLAMNYRDDGIGKTFSSISGISFIWRLRQAVSCYITDRSVCRIAAFDRLLSLPIHTQSTTRIKLHSITPSCGNASFWSPIRMALKVAHVFSRWVSLSLRRGSLAGVSEVCPGDSRLAARHPNVLKRHPTSSIDKRS